MVADASIELIAVMLDHGDGSERVVGRLVELDQSGSAEVLSVVVLAKDHNGHVHIQETPDLSKAEGAVIGAVAGGALGAVAGGTRSRVAGVLAGIAGALVGAAAGYVVGEAVDLGLPDEHLRALAKELAPGTSAVLALVEHEFVEAAVAEVRPLAARLSRYVLIAEMPAPAGEAK